MINPRDEAHASAYAFTAGFDGAIVTTAWVLLELANHLASKANRALFVAFFDDVRHDASVNIIPASQDMFDRGIERYSQRPDKDWSLTDCISFIVMEQKALTDALTTDRHFKQAGFNVLLES